MTERTLKGARALSPKMEAFATALAAGKYQAEAYRIAYPKSATWKDSTLWSEASRLASDPRIAARVAEIQRQGAEAAVFTVADHLNNLAVISKAALEARDFNAAARAEESRGKAAGFYVQRHELTGKGGAPMQSIAMSPDEYRQIARELLGKV